MGDRPAHRDWVPVAPSWERKPDDKNIWRRVVVMPSLAFNRAELDMLGTVGGRAVCVLGVGDALAPLALAAMGAKVLVVDPTHSLLDLLMVRSQVVGVEMQYLCSELTDLAGIKDGTQQLCYTAQTAAQLENLASFYAEVFRILTPGGRFVVNEYHPFRRIWKQEPGSPRVAHSYFERRHERSEVDPIDEVNPGTALGRYEHHWTISDQFNFLTQAGLVVSALEEVGEVRQHWELPNLRGLPEQLIVAADRPE